MASPTSHSEPSTRLLFAGGTVLTCDPARPRAAAVAVEGGRFVALDGEALASSARRIDLAGRTLVPGFRDGHIHPLWGGAQLLGAPIADVVDVDDLLVRLARHARQNPGLSWIVGSGYPPEILPAAIGEAAVLDSVVRDRPVALWASDHHTMWVNSMALAAAGIDAGTPDPPLGTIARHGDGSPRGTLFESATALVEPHLPAPSAEDKVRGLGLALERMAAAGIVAAQEAAVAPADVAVYQDLAAAGRLTVDVAVALRVDPERWRSQRPAFLAAQEMGGVRVRTVKLFVDGVIETGTGALLEPYTDDPGSVGIANWTGSELAEAVVAFDADGFQVHLHAIGDAAIRMALDAVGQARRLNGPRDRRAVIAHTQLVHDRRDAEVGSAGELRQRLARLVDGAAGRDRRGDGPLAAGAAHHPRPGPRRLHPRHRPPDLRRRPRRDRGRCARRPVPARRRHHRTAC